MLLLIDIGGTKTRVATSQTGAKIDNIQIHPTHSSFQEGIAQIVATAQTMANLVPFEAAGVAIPGPLSEKGDIVLSSPNLPNWQNQPVKKILEEKLACPVYLQNDAALAGLGEATYGAGKKDPIISYITISTGIGGARIKNQEIDTNALGFEPGHQIILADNGPQCGCGGFGHFEALASGSGLKRQYGQNPENITDQSIWDDVHRYIAIGLNNITVLWSPQSIILGGSVMNKINLETLSKLFVQEAIIFQNRRLPKLKRSELGDSAGLLGALALIHKQVG